ncbi:rRNA maturation RNase YbeY [Flavobacteriaceae bacterium MAR_2010_72]|nr:rRNA maturation RNase YbeY [Flavobacteriaceae bacterium MAR_2010_72]TVZ58300.1 rRNA maturation RNase YbeY [Flavobacteriaceae bacterium MAR_2010_105]
MISFNYETDFELNNETQIKNWIIDVITGEGFKLGEINYIFCDDDYLLQLNLEFLKHDTLTDIISFDYTIGKEISGDIYISVERVKDNSKDFNVDFAEELNRVMVHGVLHYCGYKDKSVEEESQMRLKENYYIGRLSNI